MPPAALADILLAAATDHYFLDGGHTLDFVNKACELLDLIGWERVTKKGSTWILELDGTGFAPAVYLPPPTN